jgi:hypothetical protein
VSYWTEHLDRTAFIICTVHSFRVMKAKKIQLAWTCATHVSEMRNSQISDAKHEEKRDNKEA